MNDIIAKLEEASEGSADLDRLIADAIGWDYPISSVPRFYTTSLDAALSLVPEHGGWIIGSGAAWMRPNLKGLPHTSAWARVQLRGDESSASAPTAALAVCAAALKARKPE